MAQVRRNPSQSEAGKEPWLAVNLSLFFPGIGQLYARQIGRGLILIVSSLVLNILGFWSIFSPSGDTRLGFVCLVLSLLVNIWSLFDAHTCAKKVNNQSFESLRKSHKDPWLAVFLSRFIPGIGHIYIGKTFLGIFLIVISLIIPFLSLILLPFVAYHVYVASPIRRESNNSSILTFAIFLFIVNLLSQPAPFLIREFIAEARYIPSGAMLPTLQINDRLIIDKVTYRFHPPQRGDIVIFLPPATASICFGDSPSSSTPGNQLQNPNLQNPFIKRVIGLPGEQVQVKNKQVYINDKPLQEQYIEDAPEYEFGPVSVPPNSYLMLGDNRNNSCDSHYWGFVPKQNIIGKAYKRFWPPERVGTI